ncbi:DegV family protein [[Eubacterium] hominis]|uniref:DegV family protein n=1 Tax=[Eubacterium] hominis TaxID=2764325 RepID=UPI003A4D606E
MKNIALLCDSSADITKEEAEKLDIHVIRMPITINGKEYIEEETIFDQDIIEALNREEQVKTAQPVIGDIVTTWKKLLESYDEVFYIPLSKALSGTCSVAITLAEQFEGKVTVVDSEYVCYPVVKQLLVAREMFEKGYDCATVKQKLETESDMFAILIPENLTALKNGGRISPAAAALAGLLKIHPLLKVEHGGIDLVDKVRTIKKAYKEGIKVVTDGIDPEEYDWMIIDANNRSMSDELKGLLEEATGRPVEQHVFKAVIMSHTGPGTIGFGRIRKLKY